MRCFNVGACTRLHVLAQHASVDVAISSDFSHHQTLSGGNNERATGYPTLGSLCRTRSAKVAGSVPNPPHTTFLANFDHHLVNWRPAPSFRTPFPITPHATGTGSKRLHDIRYFALWMFSRVLTPLLSLLAIKKLSWSSISREHYG